jgi:hypothetical protein
MLTPVALQRLEGLALLVAGVIGFAAADVSWWWLIGLILLPDLSMVGYLHSPTVGARSYNAGHTLVGPALMLGANLIWGPSAVLLAAAGIWVAHIGMDRLFGYGLKFEDDFKHTHLGWIGRSG